MLSGAPETNLLLPSLNLGVATSCTNIIVTCVVVATVVSTGGLESLSADVACKALTLSPIPIWHLSTECLLHVGHWMAFAAEKLSRHIIWGRTRHRLAMSRWSIGKLTFELRIFLFKFFYALPERCIDL